MVQLALSIFRLRSARAIALGVTATALACCALKPAPEHDAVVRLALPATTIPTAWKARPGDGVVANGWVKSLNDPALEVLINEAIANNLDLRQAAQKVTMAQQSVVVVGAQLLPVVGADLGARTTVDDGHDGCINATKAYAGVAWEIDVWGRLRAQRAAAQAGFESTELDYANARQSLAATVAKAWYLTCETRQLVALAEQSVSVYRELSDLVAIRRTAGKDSDLDVVDTRAKLASAQSSLEAARQSYGEARRVLEQLLGRYPAAEVETAAAFPQLPTTPATGIPASLLTRRPDIRAAELAVLAAFRQEEVAKLSLLPSFTVSAGGGRLDTQVLSLLNLNPWLATAGIGVSIPIYEGGALRAEVKIATAQQAQAVARYGSVVLTAFREVEDTLANQDLLAKRLPLDESALRDRTEAVRIATIQYRAGRQDLLWVSNLQTGQLATSADLIKLRGLQRMNLIRLLLALGGSIDGDQASSPQLEPSTLPANSTPPHSSSGPASVDTRPANGN